MDGLGGGLGEGARGEWTPAGPVGLGGELGPEPLPGNPRYRGGERPQRTHEAIASVTRVGVVGPVRPRELGMLTGGGGGVFMRLLGVLVELEACGWDPAARPMWGARTRRIESAGREYESPIRTRHWIHLCHAMSVL